MTTRTTPAADHLPDAELVARLRAGEEDACAALVRKYGGRLLAVAHRHLGCEQDSADAVQETFLAALRSIGSFAESAALGTWLHRIAVNTCLMKLRSRARRRMVSLEEVSSPLDGSAGRNESVPGELVRAETRARVRACIDRLPEPHREVLRLRDLEEFDTETTARLLGIKPNAVKTRLHRARQALRGLLEPLVLEEAWA